MRLASLERGVSPPHRTRVRLPRGTGVSPVLPLDPNGVAYQSPGSRSAPRVRQDKTARQPQRGRLVERPRPVQLAIALPIQLADCWGTGLAPMPQAPAERCAAKSREAAALCSRGWNPRFVEHCEPSSPAGAALVPCRKMQCRPCGARAFDCVAIPWARAHGYTMAPLRGCTLLRQLLGNPFRVHVRYSRCVQPRVRSLRSRPWALVGNAVGVRRGPWPKEGDSREWATRQGGCGIAERCHSDGRERPVERPRPVQLAIALPIQLADCWGTGLAPMPRAPARRGCLPKPWVAQRTQG
jgi:hypothetical protein